MTAISFEDAIIQACVNQFFAYTPSYVDINGQTHYVPSAAQTFVSLLWESHRDRILTALTEQLNADDVAGKIAAKIVEELNRTPNNFHDPSKPLRDAIRTRVIEKVAEMQAKDLRARLEATT